MCTLFDLASRYSRAAYAFAAHYPLLLLVVIPTAIFGFVTLSVGRPVFRAEFELFLGAVCSSCVVINSISVIWSLHLSSRSDIVRSAQSRETWASLILRHQLTGPCLFYWTVVYTITRNSSSDRGGLPADRLNDSTPLP